MNPIFQQTIWFSENNELHLNLAGIRNDGAMLILTSWNHPEGMTWQLVIEDEIEHYDDPFTAPYFLILECLTDEACSDYLQQIPLPVSKVLKQYRSESFGMLMLLSQNKNLSTLCGKYCTPFWLLFRLAKSDHWSKQQFIAMCESGILNVLKALNLPANQAALDLLNKITTSHYYSQFHVDLIQQTFFELDYQHLSASRDHLPDHLIQFLLRHPDLQHAKLIQSLDKTDYNELLQIIRKLSAEVTDTRALTKLIAESENIPVLKSHYKRLEATRTNKALQSYEKKLGDAENASRVFPQLSLFADRHELQQIISEDELLAECKLVRHNLMPYVEGIVKGQYAIYKVLKPEMALLLLMLFPTKDGGIIPVIKTIVPYKNYIDIRKTFAWLNEIKGMASKHREC